MARFGLSLAGRELYYLLAMVYFFLGCYLQLSEPDEKQSTSRSFLGGMSLYASLI